MNVEQVHQSHQQKNKTEKIVIRCTVDTLIDFKKLAAEFPNYEEAIKSFIEVFNKNAYLFPRRIRKVGPQIK